MFRFSANNAGAVIATLLAFGCLAPIAHAQNTWSKPFASNSIWNTPIASNPRYVACNLGVLGALANDRMWLFRTYSSDPFRDVVQPEGFVKPGINIPDSLYIPDEPNGCASFLLTDGVTLRDYNALRRTTNGSNPIGYYYGDHSITGDGIEGGQAGSGMSAIGGTIRVGELESGNPMGHALKLELDWAVLYKNSADQTNQSQTYRWPAVRSDGNYGGSGGGPNYTGINSALRMGSLVALPRDVDINSLGLSAKGLKIAKAIQDYGAYIVDSTGNHWQWGNGGYTMNISVEQGASTDYLRANNGYYNNDQLYYDMDKIYQRLAVIDDNSPSSIGGSDGVAGIDTSHAYKIHVKYGNMLLTQGDNAGANNTPANYFNDYDVQWQKWRFEDAGSGYYRVRNTYTNKVLTQADNAGADGTLASLFDNYDLDWQRWAVENSNGYWRIRNKYSGKVLTKSNYDGGDNTGADLFNDYSLDWQRFSLEPLCLTGTYFDNANLTGPFYIRRDNAVNFNWGAASPMVGKIAPNTFSVRWTGKIQPKYTQPYTFYVKADDGVRLWVNGVKLIDKWVNVGAATEYTSGAISLAANQKYAIKLEYYQNTGNASCQLSWSSASQAKQIIPDECTLPQ